MLTEGTDALHLDLERPADLRPLEQDADAFLEQYADRLICLDEVQRLPELFPVLRAFVDRHQRPGQILLLGSASPDLVGQTSESLAGRVAIVELTPFLAGEVCPGREVGSLRELWLRGGFPRSFLTDDVQASVLWREEFIRTFIERDLPQLGVRTPAATLSRFWRMCAHVHGQVLNQSKLGASLGQSHHSVRSYLETLSQTYVVRLLEPFHANLKKRLVKSPKLYLRDSGLLHTLLRIETQADLWSHPIYGASWEGFAIEQILAANPRWTPSFCATHSGAEVDLILERGSKRVAVECKASSAPSVDSRFVRFVGELGVDQTWVVAPVDRRMPIANTMEVAPLHDVLAALAELAPR
jgi:hypothetical protein